MQERRDAIADARHEPPRFRGTGFWTPAVPRVIVAHPVKPAVAYGATGKTRGRLWHDRKNPQLCQTQLDKHSWLPPTAHGGCPRPILGAQTAARKLDRGARGEKDIIPELVAAPGKHERQNATLFVPTLLPFPPLPTTHPQTTLSYSVS